MYVVLGGGITGLAVGYFFSKKGCKYIILEKEGGIGGLCRSLFVDGFTFDYTGHCIHLSTEWCKKFVIDELLKRNSVEVIEHKRSSYIYLYKRYIPYPIQAHLWWLPKKIKDKIIEELFILHCRPEKYNKKDEKFSDWARKMFGATLYRDFFLPYNRKVWNCDLDELTHAWTKKFVPQPSLEEFISGYISKRSKSFGYNVNFYYPLRGGISALVNSISKSISGSIICSSKVKEIDWRRKVVYFDNEEVKYEALINTIPLPELLSLLKDLPTRMKYVKDRLLWTSVYCINVGAKKTFRREMHWIYIPDRKYKFYRVGFYNNFSPYSVPSKEYMGMYIEVGVPGKEKAINVGHLGKEVISGLIDIGILGSKRDVCVVNTLYIPYGYVIYNKWREKFLGEVLGFLGENDIYSIGRYGGWKYSFIEENIIDAYSMVKYLLREG
jgi:protoporphyrinogen oxidase